MSSEHTKEILKFYYEAMREIEDKYRNTMLMKEVENDNKFYSDSDAGAFWMNNIDEFKNGEYYLSYDSYGITKIERVEDVDEKTKKVEGVKERIERVDETDKKN